MNSAADWYADAEQRERVEKKRMTNGDRIRQMTDEELAKMFARIGERCRKRAHCYNCPLDDGCNYDGMTKPFEIWLKQDVSEDAYN